MHKVYCFLIGVGLSSLLSCLDHHTRSLLSEADSLMMSDPAKALEVISEIDTSKLFSARVKAFYSLMHTMAIDRNAIDTTDFRLLQDAIDYYTPKSKDSREKAYTLFYLGRLKYNNGDYTSSSVTFKKVLNSAYSQTDPWLSGMCYTFLGLIYINCHNIVDELDYSLKAFDAFSSYGDSVYINNARSNLAFAYHNNRFFDKADSLFECIDKESRYYADGLVGRAMNTVTSYNPDYAKACQWFDEAIKLNAYFSPDSYFQFTFSLMKNGQPERAEKLLKQLDAFPPNARCTYWKYKIAEAKGDESAAYSFLKEYNIQSDSLVQAHLMQSQSRAERDLWQLDSERLALQEKVSRANAILVSIVISLLLLSILLFFLWRQNALKQKLSELELDLSEARRLKELSDSEKRDIAGLLYSLRVKYASMYQDQFSQIGKLFDKNLDYASVLNKGHNEFMSKVRDVLSTISNDTSGQNSFEERLDTTLDGIMTKLRKDFPFFNERTFRLLSFIIAGFEPSTIAAIMNENASSVRSRKSRLKQQILSSDSPNKELYEMFLK